MSAHSVMPWKQGDPITDELVQEVASCTQANYGWAGGGFRPGCFAILGPVDGLIYNFGGLLDSWDRKTDFREHAVKFTEGKEEHAYFVELAVRALPLMKFPEPREKKEFPTTLSIPKVNREYPPLEA